MPRLHLTDRLLPSLFRQARDAGKRLEFMDSGYRSRGAQRRGFGFRVSPEGDGAWFVRFSRRGQRQRQTLGRHPAMTLKAAHAAADEIYDQVDAGLDPAAEQRRRRGVVTFGELADAYVHHIRHRPRPVRTWKNVQSMIEKDLRPAWANVPADQISRDDIRHVLRGIAEGRGAPVQANRTQACISAIYAFGLDHEDLLADVMQYNPAAGLKKIGVERRATRALSWEELRALWGAWEADGTVGALAHQFGLLTGQRRTEILAGRFEEIEWLELGVWWELAGTRTKNGRAHRVFLPPLACCVLERMMPGAAATAGVARGWLFPSTARPDRRMKDVRKASERAIDRSGVEGWTFKTLRATVAARMAELGVEGWLISEILNHTRSSVTERNYSVDRYADQKRAAMIRYADRLSREVGETAEVLPFS